VVRLGRPRAFYGYLTIITITYLSIITGVVAAILPPYTLIALLTVPKAIKAVQTAKLHHSQSQQLVPANAATVAIHLNTGLLLSAGYAAAAIL
jgi:1,4-dihydroxy-2-naphthoate octaprenyltransferase